MSRTPHAVDENDDMVMYDDTEHDVANDTMLDEPCRDAPPEPMR